MAHLYLIRGLPGSGKTTFAKQMYDYGVVHYEADQFFEMSGEYRFDPRMLTAAHDWCWSKTMIALCDGYDVIVSNTFTQFWELARYLDFRSTLPGTTISIIEMRTQYRSVHGISDQKMDQMRQRWVTLPDDFEIPIKIVGETE